METASLIFTPHSVREKIVDKILFDIQTAVPIIISFRRRIFLNMDDICVMYPELANNPVLNQVSKCLLDGESEFVAVNGDGVTGVIKQIKGKFYYSDGKANPTGLRKKYQKDDSSFEHIFHSTNSENESDLIGERLFGVDYLKGKSMNPKI